ncbi:LAFA_0G00452g1_1 [Lachancea sp. 'fantastica']|nr:LAFA_0G00452g1_1 [Lachancea sp. 'fantastica']
MEFHTKRSRAAVGLAPEPLPLKRRAVNAVPSSPPSGASRGMAHVPRTSILVAKNGSSSRRSSASSSDDSDVAERTGLYRMSFSRKPAVHFKASPRVDPMLFEAVSRYSDSENEQDGEIANLGPQVTPAKTPQRQLEQLQEAATMQSKPLEEHQQALENAFAPEKRKSPSRHASFSSISRKQTIPHSDSEAQERCFDYLLQSIDEVWARYCNETSTAEAKVYDSMCKPHDCPPGFLTPTADDFSVAHTSNPGSPRYRRTFSFTSVNRNGTSYSDDDSDDTSGYKSEATNPTEYETDCDYRKISKLPDSVRLQSLKDRLCRAKNDLEGLHGSTCYEECAKFWRRWDMIKYGAVEMMEEDDEDEVIESVIDELERGRCFTN